MTYYAPGSWAQMNSVPRQKDALLGFVLWLSIKGWHFELLEKPPWSTPAGAGEELISRLGGGGAAWGCPSATPRLPPPQPCRPLREPQGNHVCERGRQLCAGDLAPSALTLPSPTSPAPVTLRQALGFSLSCQLFKTRRLKLADARRCLPTTNPHPGPVLLSCLTRLSDACWSGLARSNPGWQGQVQAWPFGIQAGRPEALR